MEGSDTLAQALVQEKLYTIDDIYTLPDGERAELIDGQIYYMAPPNRMYRARVFLVAGQEKSSGSSGSTSNPKTVPADLMSHHLLCF